MRSSQAAAQYPAEGTRRRGAQPSPSPPCRQGANTCTGEGDYDYPQIKVEERSPSPLSPAEHFHAGDAACRRAGPCQLPTPVFRSCRMKDYKAYKWLHYSSISSNNKDGEHSLVPGEADEGRAEPATRTTQPLFQKECLFPHEGRSEEPGPAP